MPNRSPEERFGRPANFAELQQRIAMLGGEITEIMADLANKDLQAKYGDGYRHWRSRALKAQAAKIAEIGYLKSLRQEFDQLRQEQERAARKERQQRHAERIAELRAAETWTPEETIIRELYRALMRQYRITGEMPSEQDFTTIAQANIYLVDRKLLD